MEYIPIGSSHGSMSDRKRDRFSKQPIVEVSGDQ